ncbi:MAG: hydantoinase B/oxoprolinase family protein [Spirochaetes bacterium]|nr:hydantoinase B/oxoprolinase family protein [Spirochaetota bacterium]
MDIDPFTVEIVRSQLIAASEESFIALGKSSQSPIIYEVLDYACAITDREGNIVAQANGVPGFLGTLTFAVKAVLEKFPPTSLRPGDTVITNDPYVGGGNHLSDVALISPIFSQEKLVAFGVNKAHWTEVGGMAPGSWTTDSTEIYQEGLQFPVIRIGKGYTLDRSLLDLIAHNVRTPDRTLGDLYAGIASLRTAESRVKEIVDRCGVDMFERCIAEILDHGERLARQALAALPEGTYRAEEYMDDDGLSGDPVYVCVKVTIGKDRFTADFTGSSPAVRGPINCTRTRLHSATRSIFKAVTDPEFPVNDGWFRPLEVVCPPRTVFTAERPSPVSTYWETGAYACDLIWRALFEIFSDRLTAGHSLSVCGTIISGKDEDNETFILVEPQAGGWGAGVDKDGENGLVVVGDGETYVMPVEVCEARYPLLVERYAFNTPPAGAGAFRGGFGLIRDYRIVCEEASLTTTFGRHKYPPWGAGGGNDGSENGVYVFKGDKKKPVLYGGKLARYPLEKGDLVRLQTGTGGGFGPPQERDPQLVRADVENGFLSLTDAREVYAVEIDPSTLRVDSEKTKRLRGAKQ